MGDVVNAYCVLDIEMQLIVLVESDTPYPEHWGMEYANVMSGTDVTIAYRAHSGDMITNTIHGIMM